VPFPIRASSRRLEPCPSRYLHLAALVKAVSLQYVLSAVRLEARLFQIVCLVGGFAAACGRRADAKMQFHRRQRPYAAEATDYNYRVSKLATQTF
jgi:hypothetical protein